MDELKSLLTKLDEAKEIGIDSAVAEGNIDLAIYFYEKDDLDKSYEYFKNALETSKAICNNAVFETLATFYYYFANNDFSIDKKYDVNSYIDALEGAEKQAINDYLDLLNELKNNVDKNNAFFSLKLDLDSSIKTKMEKVLNNDSISEYGFESLIDSFINVIEEVYTKEEIIDFPDKKRYGQNIVDLLKEFIADSEAMDDEFDFKNKQEEQKYNILISNRETIKNI